MATRFIRTTRSLTQDSGRAALLGWARFVIIWQVAVLVLAGLWILSFVSNHVHGFTWAIPAIGLVLGTALPLQLVVMRISRANR